MDDRWSLLLKAAQQQHKKQQQQQYKKAFLIFFKPDMDETTRLNYRNFLRMAKSKHFPVYLMNKNTTWRNIKNALKLTRKQEYDSIVKNLFENKDTRGNITKIMEIEKIPRQNIHYIGPDVSINQVQQSNKHTANSHQQTLQHFHKLIQE
jgi:hypothetical protein